MDKKSNNIPLVVLLSIIVLSVFAAYDRFFLTRNYDIYTQVSCDPQIEACYKTTNCPQDLPDCSKPETSYYKILRIKAYDLSYCNHNVQNCPEPICKTGEDCAYIKCDPNIKSGAQICGD